uniref:hypothetical protein n=1 Tax=Pseudomonas sp. REB1044 TaxID=2675224 RepID=UPI00406BFED3
MSTAKSYNISKLTVWEAYQRVKANRGAAGIDEQSIAQFEQKLQPNLYKVWNRMSSGLERLPQTCSVEDYEALLPWNCTPQMCAIHKPHLPNSGGTGYRGISGEQFHGSSAS